MTDEQRFRFEYDDASINSNSNHTDYDEPWLFLHTFKSARQTITDLLTKSQQLPQLPHQPQPNGNEFAVLPLFHLCLLALVEHNVGKGTNSVVPLLSCNNQQITEDLKKSLLYTSIIKHINDCLTTVVAPETQKKLSYFLQLGLTNLIREVMLCLQLQYADKEQYKANLQEIMVQDHR
jgi:hypothetical protein